MDTDQARAARLRMIARANEKARQQKRERAYKTPLDFNDPTPEHILDWYNRAAHVENEEN